ncbi:hypothetical protein LCGC14_1291200 [marine sediment metagenome]|uniref:DUF86 domain-containing protein n=1 Tax=marine sediment metagenome TaxID=412755 RepID=A0A0F9KSG5_9ZZZZ|nr:MAG: hypothetical protein Lokiarch_19630 [Candidatus Lokiarchaeum sp. GC14_75]
MKRTEQYRRKLEFIIEKISVLPNNLIEDKFHVDALFYRLQVSIDATMDVIAMFCKDLGITVKDDYSNIDELEKLKIFSSILIKDLRRWNGLRNILVHRYNKVEEDLVIKVKDDVVTTLKTFVKDVEVLIDEKLNLSE